jgi:Holliday junction resolvase RusA-like endonuclease
MKQFEGEEEVKAIHELEVPMLPPSVNSYWKVAKWGGRYITPDGIRFKNLLGAINRGQRVTTTKRLRLVIELHNNEWLTKKGAIRKIDLDNFSKCCCDALFAAIGLDDSFIWELFMFKIEAQEKKTRFTLLELE